MIEARRGGHLVNVSSAAGIIGMPWHAAYSASKFGLRGVSEVLRFDLRRHRHRGQPGLPGRRAHRRSPRPSGSPAIDKESPAFRKAQAGFHKRAVTPEKAAEAIIKGVHRNKYWVYTSNDIRMIHLLQRYFPPGYVAGHARHERRRQQGAARRRAGDPQGGGVSTSTPRVAPGNLREAGLLVSGLRAPRRPGHRHRAAGRLPHARPAPPAVLGLAAVRRRADAGRQAAAPGDRAGDPPGGHADRQRLRAAPSTAASGRRAGLTADEIDRVADGPDATAGRPRDRLLLRVTDELHARAGPLGRDLVRSPGPARRAGVHRAGDAGRSLHDAGHHAHHAAGPADRPR